MQRGSSTFRQHSAIRLHYAILIKVYYCFWKCSVIKMMVLTYKSYDNDMLCIAAMDASMNSSDRFVFRLPLSILPLNASEILKSAILHIHISIYLYMYFNS